MSYTISISGHADTEDDEQALVTALQGLIGDGTEYGITSAQGFFQFEGTVDLLPAAPPAPDPKEELDAAVTALDDLVAEKLTPAEDGTITLSADDASAINTALADVQTEVEAYEASVSSAIASAEGNSASSSDTSSTSSPGTPGTGDGTSPTGTGTADAPTLSTGERVAL